MIDVIETINSDGLWFHIDSVNNLWVKLNICQSGNNNHKGSF